MTKFNRFEDIEHKPLRVYNRSVMAFNIRDDHGEEVMKEYLESFSEQERFEMAALLTLVKKLGVDKVRLLVTKDLELPEEA